MRNKRQSFSRDIGTLRRKTNIRVGGDMYEMCVVTAHGLEYTTFSIHQYTGQTKSV